MLSLVGSLVLALAPSVQDPAPEPPAPEAVKAAVDGLKAAFTTGKTGERIRAIEQHGAVADEGVVEWLDKGVRDEDPTVQAAAIEALRFSPLREALDSLHATYKRDKKLQKDVELFSKLLKAIAQHGDKSSVPILADNAFGNVEHKVIEARILGLGNVRAPEAVEALISMMRVGGRHKIQPYMQNFRMALMVLTGADRGIDQDGWMSWWNENKKDFAVPPKAAPLPKDMQVRWDYYWGNEAARERAKKRRERGDDGEAKGGGASGG
jgi:hypothetical protein